LLFSILYGFSYRKARFVHRIPPQLSGFFFLFFSLFFLKMSIFRHFFLLTLDFPWKVRFIFQFQLIVFPYKFGAFLQDPSFCASAQNTSLFLYISNNPFSLTLLFLVYRLTAFLSKKKGAANNRFSAI